MSRLRAYWDWLRSSLWLLPAVWTAGAVALALVLIAIDGPARIAMPGLGGIGAGAEGARSMLAAIATSIITVAGVAFSVTVVALALAASQYSPRVLRTFMRDRVTQTCLGLLVATFAYCLTVLGSIDGERAEPFIPALAVLGGIVLAFVSIAAFVYFIHHVATAITASHILAGVARETVEAVDVLFPDELGDTDTEALEDRADADMGPWQAVAAPGTGYLQTVNEEGLLAFAREHRAVVRMERPIGEFVIADTTLASVGTDRRLEPAQAVVLRRCFTIDRQRTVVQDAAFGIRQMVDVAMKALSPGVNDTTTAVMCVDWLIAVLVRLSKRRIPDAARTEDGQLRVIARVPSYRDLVDLAFDQIRLHARDNTAVLLRQLQGLDTLLTETGNHGRRAVLRRHIDHILAAARHHVIQPFDLEPIERLGRRLGGGSPGQPGRVATKTS